MTRHGWQSLMVVMLLLLVAGCMDSPAPTPSPVAPSLTPTRQTTPVTRPPGTATPSASTPLPSTPSATALPPTATPLTYAPLNLGVAQGNTYGGFASAVDQQRGLLYVLGRRDGSPTQEGSISIVDLAQSRVRATIALTTPVEFQARLLLSGDGTRLFVLGVPDRPTSSLIVVSSGVGSGRPGEVMYTRAGVYAMEMDAAADVLYVLEGNTLRQIDAKTMREGPAVAVPAVTNVPLPMLALNTTAQRLYLARPDSKIMVFSTQDMRAIGEIQMYGRVKGITPHLARPETYALVEILVAGERTETISVLRDADTVATWNADAGFSIGRVVVNPVNGQLVLLEDARDYQARQSRLRLLDPATGTTLIAVPLPALNLAYAYAPLVYNHTLYLMGNQASPISLATGAVGTPIPLGVNLAGAALDVQGNRLFVIDTLGTLHLINTETFSETAAWQGVVDPASTNLYRNALSVVGDRVFVPSDLSGRTAVLDAASGKQVATLNKAGPVTLDTRRGRLLMAAQGIYTLDPTTFQITGVISGTQRESAMMASPGAVGVSYDEALDMIFATMSNNSAGSSSSSWLQIYDGATMTRISSTINTDQRFLAGLVAEAIANRVWVASGYPGQSLTAFSRNGDIQTRIKGLGNRLMLDSERQRLYVADWDGIVTVDTRTLSVSGFLPTSLVRATFAVYDTKHRRIYTNLDDSALVLAIDPDARRDFVPGAAATLPTGRIENIYNGDGGEIIVRVYETDGGRMSLWRSDGDGWRPFSPGIVQVVYAQLVTAPGAPGAVFAYSEGMYSFGFFRSTDGGRTWQVIGNGLTDYHISNLVLSPNFAKDGTAILTTMDRSVFVSRDAGQSWARLPDVSASSAGLAISEDGSPRFILAGADTQVLTRTLIYTGSSEGMVILKSSVELAVDSYRLGGLAVARGGKTVLRCVNADSFSHQGEGFLLSEDFGQTWSLVNLGTSSGGRCAIVYSPSFTTDRTVYALLYPYFFKPTDRSVLLRSLDGGHHWEQAVNADPLISALAMLPNGQLSAGTTQGVLTRLLPASLRWQPFVAITPTPLPSPPPFVTPVPTPIVRASPTPVLYPPDPLFQNAWGTGDQVRRLVGQALEPSAREVWVALQPFEGGRMIWRQDTRQVLVLPYGLDWAAYDDTWVEGQPETDPAIVPPAGKLQPKRGFGKVWRTVSIVRQRLGWAPQEEQGYTAEIQTFQSGVVIRIENVVYVIGQQDGKPAWLSR